MQFIDLPLFPLGTVLLPSMLLPLHIFEPRYRQMIGECLRHDRRFGVVLIREGLAEGETASAYDVGTVAEITATSRMDDGRLHLMTEGRERFRIVQRFYDRSYLHGSVEFLDEPLGLMENASPLAAETSTLARRYVHMLLKQAEEEPIDVDLPPEPLDLSYRLAGLLQQVHPASPTEMQYLLEAATAEDRLRRESLILRRELAILDWMALLPPPRKQSHFSPN